MSGSIFGSAEPLDDPWALPAARNSESALMDRQPNAWGGYNSEFSDPLTTSFGGLDVNERFSEEEEDDIIGGVIQDPLLPINQDEGTSPLPKHVKAKASTIADVSETQTSEVWTDELTDSFNPLSYHNNTDKTIIRVKEIPEKEGLVFKHINYLITHNIVFPREYQVQQERGELKIVRRYSDFAWLIEVLWKKYPFRIIPDLPPKKFTIGTSSTDSVFLQRRRRGLQRFLNQVMKHPILSKESLVVMFLTVPNDFANWKKFANIDYSDEFNGLRVSLPRRFKLNLEKVFKTQADDDEEDDDEDKPSSNIVINNITQIWSESPQNFRDLDFIESLGAIDNQLNKFGELWSKLCILVERIERREIALSQDQQRFGHFLKEFSEINSTIYGMSNLLPVQKGGASVIGTSSTGEADERQNLGIINALLRTIVSYLFNSKQLKDQELASMDSETLENFKKFQDYIVALKLMLERLIGFKATSERDLHLLLNKITRANERLTQVKIKADVKGSEIDRLIQILQESSSDLYALITKIILVKNCVVSEFKIFQKTKYLLSEVFQDWFVEKVKYGDLEQQSLARCFNELQDMPLK
ncbi:unnamed protein product [Kuraishia capsulata CBS 1993]|uniref:Sorting nexin MVP1 n=1 Tax=Kuraishia capsulata CBS 1993 TaxID=1382522 RepID=W6MJV7_9ASCO|nr:uncharacterized protein KUCA_T00002543001 [Kuraishia capsulata CBS 1993]CDK26571.1 unnamed protein product [Kuraishia capsulata CBS 1993]